MGALEARPRNRRDTRSIAFAIAVLSVLATVFVPAALASGGVEAAVLASPLAQRAIALQGVTIKGDLDLRRKHVHGFSCHDCELEGSLLATGAWLSGNLDLTGSEVSGDVDLKDARLTGDFLAPGAMFDGLIDLRGAKLGSVRMPRSRLQAPLVAGDDTSSPTMFRGPADFSLVGFSSRVTFENAVFRKADFRLATFASDAIFASAQAVNAAFTRAIVRGGADFSGFSFLGDSTFQGADFEGPADFSTATFGAVSFFQSRLAQGATFVGAGFSEPAEATDESGGTGRPMSVDFRQVVSRSDLDFAFARFDEPIDFSNAVVSGVLSFTNATFAVSGGVSWYEVSAQNLEMSVTNALRAVAGAAQQQTVLSGIEATAKEHGNLGLANDALYARQEIRSDRYPLPWRVLDFALYRWIAGYFVRPLRPLAWLLILAALATILRDATLKERRQERIAERSEQRSGSAPRSSRRLRSRQVGKRLVRAFRELPHTLRVTGRAFRNTLFLIVPGSSRSKEREGREGEIFVYGILLACALVGFANSTPTLRQMIDAIH
jgi:uncharacterized protein YjbI with pentapeptide repeats